MVGVLQWLDEQSFRFDASTTFSWLNVTGGKGRLFNEGPYDIKLLGGGDWNGGASCGSRCRGADRCRWSVSANIGFRLVARGITK